MVIAIAHCKQCFYCIAFCRYPHCEAEERPGVLIHSSMCVCVLLLLLSCPGTKVQSVCYKSEWWCVTSTLNSAVACTMKFPCMLIRERVVVFSIIYAANSSCFLNKLCIFFVATELFSYIFQDKHIQCTCRCCILITLWFL